MTPRQHTSRTHRTRSGTWLRTAAVALPLVLAAAGCATADPTETASGSSASGSCGVIPSVAPKDPDGVVASLPESLRAAYNGLPGQVNRSAWADWKPTTGAPHKVAILWNPPINTFSTTTLAALKTALTSSGDATITTTLAPSAVTDVPAQLQQLDQVIAARPDLIVLEPLAAAPFIAAVDKAAAAGIPVIGAWNLIPSAKAVSVGVNNFLQAATLASKVVTAMGGSGKVLQVRGVAGVAQDAEAAAGFAAVLKGCPNIDVVGSVNGDYSTSTTKSAVLQFLAANPGTIDGVLQSGQMTTGVIGAFEQLGRRMPYIADVGATQGSIAYAHAHSSTYKEFGTASADAAIGETIGRVALKVLAGDGPRISQIVTQPAYIDNGDVDAIYRSGWTLSSNGDAAAADDPFLTTAALSGYFARSQS